MNRFLGRFRKSKNQNNPKYPIYIPSKGRADNCKTANMLIRHECNNFYIVVEPQDEDAYRAIYGPEHILVLDMNDMGLAYSRRACKVFSTEAGDDFHWMIDDDMLAFFMREGKKNITYPIYQVLKGVEEYVDAHSNIGLAGTTHSLFAWTKKTEIGLNKSICQCCLIRNDLDVWWTDDIAAHDCDYSLKVLHYEDMRWCTVLMHKYLHNAVPTVQAKNGLAPLRHDLLARTKACQLLVDSWPGFLIMAPGRFGVPTTRGTRRWTRTFKQVPIKKKGWR